MPDHPWPFGLIIQNTPSLVGMVIRDQRDSAGWAQEVVILYDLWAGGAHWAIGDIQEVSWDDIVEDENLP